MMETELFKLLANGGVSVASVGVLIWIVIKHMPAQQERFLAALKDERTEFLNVLKEEREQFAEDRAEDRHVRHYLGNVVQSLSLNLVAAGVKITIPPPSEDVKTAVPPK